MLSSPCSYLVHWKMYFAESQGQLNNIINDLYMSQYEL